MGDGCRLPNAAFHVCYKQIKTIWLSFTLQIFWTSGDEKDEVSETSGTISNQLEQAEILDEKIGPGIMHASGAGRHAFEESFSSIFHIAYIG